MLKGFFIFLVLLAVFSGLCGCATLEPQKTNSVDSTPKVKEEDITHSGSTNPAYQVPQNSGPSQGSEIGQAAPPLSSPTDTGAGRAPRRFIWKDKH
ncbi:MAG: hypothetical protein ACP5U1_02360 [Desulfomonilaceae bacterium]